MRYGWIRVEESVEKRDDKYCISVRLDEMRWDVMFCGVMRCAVKAILIYS